MAVKKPGTAVVSWQEQLEKEAVEGAQEESVSTKSISFKSGVLSFDGAPIPGNKINVIVLDWAFAHTWYPNQYDPNRQVSPSCFALGRKESELMAHEDSEDPQGDSEGSCMQCPLNQWGSDPDGGKGKACKNIRRLSLISADTLKQGEKGITAAEAVMAHIPVMSVKNWSAFVVQIANVVKRPPYGVIAELSVVPDQRSQFQVKWTFVDTVPDAMIPALMEKRKALGDAILAPYPKNEEEAPAKPSAPPQRGVARPATKAQVAASKGKRY